MWVDRTKRPVFIDIDGTLTVSTKANAEPIPERIKHVRKLIEAGHQVVVWSGRGTEYAQAFVSRNSLFGVVAIGKPELIVDDQPEIRPSEHMPIVTPKKFFLSDD